MRSFDKLNILFRYFGQSTGSTGEWLKISCCFKFRNRVSIQVKMVTGSNVRTPGD
jgi:hypothetical protein